MGVLATRRDDDRRLHHIGAHEDCVATAHLEARALVIERTEANCEMVLILVTNLRDDICHIHVALSILRQSSLLVEEHKAICLALVSELLKDKSMRDRDVARSMRLKMLVSSKEVHIDCIVRVVLSVLD